MIDSIRLGKKAKNQLIGLKRKTGIQNWNVLCRWAFTLSIMEPTRPREVSDLMEGGVEMTWRTFGGENERFYEALLKSRVLTDFSDSSGIDLTKQLRQHIYRGLGYLATSNRINNIADLALLALAPPSQLDTQA